jgi:hypothetical protein
MELEKRRKGRAIAKGCPFTDIKQGARCEPVTEWTLLFRNLQSFFLYHFIPIRNSSVFRIFTNLDTFALYVLLGSWLCSILMLLLNLIIIMLIL